MVYTLQLSGMTNSEPVQTPTRMNLCLHSLFVRPVRVGADICRDVDIGDNRAPLIRTRSFVPTRNVCFIQNGLLIRW